MCDIICQCVTAYDHMVGSIRILVFDQPEHGRVTATCNCVCSLTRRWETYNYVCVLTPALLLAVQCSSGPTWSVPCRVLDRTPYVIRHTSDPPEYVQGPCMVSSGLMVG